MYAVQRWKIKTPGQCGKVYMLKSTFENKKKQIFRALTGNKTAKIKSLLSQETGVA